MISASQKSAVDSILPWRVADEQRESPNLRRFAARKLCVRSRHRTFGAIPGTKTVAINGAITPGGPAIGAQNQQKINEVKAGLNWRFAPNLW
jgi:hypothetical protein